MDVQQMVATLAPAATVKELAADTNRVFRLREESGASSIVKVYASTALERRERHALEALAGVKGVPAILERGATDGRPWIRMSDGGAWNLATLPKNLEAAAKAGAVLRAVHDSGAPITNLDSGISAEYVATHFASTLDRLERYRRRLGMPADVLLRARTSERLPQASPPVPAHTRPYPRSFLVAESGEVTLVEWEWATLAPPEWDLSLARWRFSREIGSDAAESLWAGYGATFPPERLKPWIAYHSAMMMLDAAEQRDGRLGDLAYLIDDLEAALD